MRKTALLAPLMAAILPLAACGDPAEEADDPLVSGSPAPAATTAEAERQAGTTQTGIPQALQGRWGLVPADCEPGRADAKGLMEVSQDTLTFYESRGQLGEVERSSDDALRAQFAFTGEGMEWRNDIALQVQDSGTMLVRRDYGPDAAPEPLTYTRCEQ